MKTGISITTMILTPFLAFSASGLECTTDPTPQQSVQQHLSVDQVKYINKTRESCILNEGCTAISFLGIAACELGFEMNRAETPDYKGERGNLKNCNHNLDLFKKIALRDYLSQSQVNSILERGIRFGRNINPNRSSLWGCHDFTYGTNGILKNITIDKKN